MQPCSPSLRRNRGSGNDEMRQALITQREQRRLTFSVGGLW